MKKHLSYLLWMTFSVGFILLFAFESKAADVRLFYANSGPWASDAAFSSTTGATFGAAQLYPPIVIPGGGSRLIEGFGPSGFGVQTFAIDGEVRAWTEASFSDGATTNSIEIPALPPALDSSGVYDFEGIENGQRGRATYIALVADAPTVLILDVYDAGNNKLGSEGLSVVSGFAFYKLTTPVVIGRAELRVVSGFTFGWPTNGKVYAVAFVGRDSGKPRAEVPTLH